MAGRSSRQATRKDSPRAKIARAPASDPLHRQPSHARGDSTLHVGILAHSADGAALCFLEMIRESARVVGPHLHPEITLSILPMGDVLDAWERTDLETINRHLMRTAQRLESAGCDFFVCPDNTAHIAL